MKLANWQNKTKNINKNQMNWAKVEFDNVSGQHHLKGETNIQCAVRAELGEEGGPVAAIHNSQSGTKNLCVEFPKPYSTDKYRNQGTQPNIWLSTRKIERSLILLYLSLVPLGYWFVLYITLYCITLYYIIDILYYDIGKYSRFCPCDSRTALLSL